MAFFVYILASGERGTLYIGVTNDIARRVHEHKAGAADGFTKRHGVSRLVYYELFDTAVDAIQREKALKRWRRDWKLNLIDHTNPDWRDLYETLNA
ncbi:MAG: GIY-YIG nuclease family protein [Oceanibaculum nanhaiense]|uniref:GIY-YIG nuclease family protein n=1 Tax=Oceanibaculum nanhaiense TaxID=1909734 RepID=UPI0025A3FD0A|nr:GIY-YIG nuclease family protein [Oceanibaculum nanhaiense]MDM7947914.1 GIY-YIG nuclease family protein [Oceanibaculum nanhaiense]